MSAQHKSSLTAADKAIEAIYVASLLVVLVLAFGWMLALFIIPGVAVNHLIVRMDRGRARRERTVDTENRG